MLTLLILAASQGFDFGQNRGTRPQCVGDPDCVALCYTTRADTCEWQCVDNTGAQLSGMTQGVVQLCRVGFAGRLVQYGQNDSVSAANLSQVVNQNITDCLNGECTVIAAGFSRTLVESAQWWGMMFSDLSNQFQMRSESGEFRCIAGGRVAGAARDGRDGQHVVSCRRSHLPDGGWALTARANGVQTTVEGGAAISIASGHPFRFGGGTDYCSPSSSIAGELHWVGFYRGAKPDYWTADSEAAWWGASNVNFEHSAVPQLLGVDMTTEHGAVEMFAPGSVITSPEYGVQSVKNFKNYWGANPLAVCSGTNIGTPVCTPGAASGPFAAWNGAPEMALLEDDAGVFSGKASPECVTGPNVYDGWYNLTTFAKAGSTSDARLMFLHDGAVDGGSELCDITLGAGVSRQPGADTYSSGCYAFIHGASYVCGGIAVGHAPADVGSIYVSQMQLTKTLYATHVTVDNQPKGNGWVQLRGELMPHGHRAFRVKVVYRLPYSSALFDRPNNVNDNHGLNSFILDAYSAVPLHVVTFFSGASLSGIPSIMGLMYGPVPNGINKFDPRPFPLARGVWYGMEYRGSYSEASGCTGALYHDVCASPSNCPVTTKVAENATPGQCPPPVDRINLAQRYDGTDPADVQIFSVEFER